MLRPVHDSPWHPPNLSLPWRGWVVALLATAGLSCASRDRCSEQQVGACSDAGTPDAGPRDAGSGGPLCSSPVGAGRTEVEVPGNLVLRDVYGSAPADVWVTTEPV